MKVIFNIYNKKILDAFPFPMVDFNSFSSCWIPHHVNLLGISKWQKQEDRSRILEHTIAYKQIMDKIDSIKFRDEY